MPLIQPPPAVGKPATDHTGLRMSSGLSGLSRLSGLSGETEAGDGPYSRACLGEPPGRRVLTGRLSLSEPEQLSRSSCSEVKAKVEAGDGLH